MIELFEQKPDVQVQPGEYRRLLGYPPGAELHDRALELSAWARDWYAAHGRPWIYAKQIDGVAVRGDAVEIRGVHFTAARLRRLLSDADAESVVVVAASAGAEAEEHARRLWEEGKPDEYFFLEVFGSAVVEHLVMTTGAELCAWADVRQRAVLPHDSPGYPDWEIAEQADLLRVIAAARGSADRLPLDVLDSGMLRPKKSLLAVFGLTRHVDRVRRLTDLVPCEGCAFERCQFRRAPYRQGGERRSPELPAVAQPAATAAVPVEAAPVTLDRDAKYTVNVKALRRWAAERLTLEREAGGGIRAEFRYDGTTCTNMGQPLAFLYQVTLGPRDEGYRILSQRCAPAAGDSGHTYMCKYISRGDELLQEIAIEDPLAGRRLNDVIGWSRPHASAGCYCDRDSRLHKWGLVFETLHYALVREDEEAMAQMRQEVRS